MKSAVPFLLLLASIVLVSGDEYHPDFAKQPKNKVRSGEEDKVEDKAYWEQLGYDDLMASLDVTSKVVPDHAQNVIIFVGDGMSLPTVTATRIYKAQKLENNFEDPESQYLTFEKLDHMGLSKTYAIDKQTVDSSASASAMFSGVKTKYGTMGFDSHIERGVPSSMDPSIEVTTIMSHAQQSGMATGVVTTARLTHATPGATYAHVMDRDWECDAKFDDVNDTEEPKPDDYNDIAWQLVNKAPGKNMNVVIGGGYPAFYPASMEEDLNDMYGPYEDTWSCYRTDETDLTQQWIAQKEDAGETAAVVMNKSELDDLDLDTVDNLMGFFGQDHMSYDHNRQTDRDPSLSDLVEKAITILKKKGNGFVLLVEAGRIDHAHHEVLAKTALDEAVALDLAVETAMDTLGESLDETLIIVTADHAHTMSIAGYPSRGNSIIGLSGDTYEDLGAIRGERKLIEGLPYTTLSYANGRAFYVHNIPDPDVDWHITRLNLTDIDVEAWDFEYTSAGPRSYETHGGDDVGIFASGPGASLFHRAHEQTHIFQVMSYAACVGDYKGYTAGNEYCEMRDVTGSTTEDGSDGNTTTDFTGDVTGSTTGDVTGSTTEDGSDGNTTTDSSATIMASTFALLLSVLANISA